MGLAKTTRCMIQLVRFMDTDYYRQQQLASGVMEYFNKKRNLYKTVVSHNTIVLMWSASTNMTACTWAHG